MQNSYSNMAMNNSYNSLVSVVVFTYNSSATVLETLESIKNQTYKNIELIITDDSSKDETVSICKKWIDANGENFVHAKFLTSEKNTGISANANRGCFASHGEWIKIIAGDDRLLPDCIEKLMTHAKMNPRHKILFAKVVGFGNMEAADRWPFKNVKWLFDNLSFKEMKILLTQTNFLPAASVFIKIDVFDEIGGFDETIPLLEDWPFWVKAVFHNIPLYFFDEYVVEYRFSEESISMGVKKNNSIYKDSLKMAIQYAESHLSKVSMLMAFYYWTLHLKCSGSKFGRCIHVLNVINPEYYRLRRVKQKWSFFCSHIIR